MKKYVWLYSILVVMLSAGFLLYMNIPKMIQSQEVDLVAINEIAKMTALHWQQPEQLNQADLAYRFTAIDNDGQVLYTSDEGLPANIPEAVRQGFVPIDIIVGTSIVGKALVEVSQGDTVKDAQSRLAAAALLMFILLCALTLVSLWALHNALVKPFRRMQSFAHKITTGKFDEPIPTDKKNTFGLFTQSFDVMRASLFEARQNQFKAERAKKELIASLSHDIKTPVTSIRLISELLQAGNTDPAMTEKLKTIEIKADQIDRLMNDMLHSTLEELGELKVKPSIETSSILSVLFENVDHLAKVRIGIIPICLVELDVIRMEQVIGNIINNSYKYAGTNIYVDCKICGEFLQVDVNDFGKGVGPEEVELITTKFFRGENAKASQKEGEGLGLYISKLLMDKMGSGLETLNRDDGFTVRLWIRLSR